MDQPAGPAPKPWDTLAITFPAKVWLVAQGTKTMINNLPPDSKESHIFLLSVFHLEIKEAVAAFVCCSLE